MPAHQGPGAIGVAIKSDGKPITVLEWRANRLVDAIAKAEASRGMAPQGTVDLLNSATALVQRTAAQIGAATHAANNHITVVQLESGKTVNKTVRDAQQAPTKRTGRKPCCKTAVPRKEPPAEDSSDWNTEDEVQAYGPNTKRARRAAQKKLRKRAEHDALERVVQGVAASLKAEVRRVRPDAEGPSTAVEELDCEHLRTAVDRLVNAASGDGTPPQDGPTATATRCATEGASCSSLDFLASVPSQTSLAPCRTRPVRGNGQSQTRGTTEALQTLLGKKHHRSCLGEELKRKNHQC